MRVLPIQQTLHCNTTHYNTTNIMGFLKKIFNNKKKSASESVCLTEESGYYEFEVKQWSKLGNTTNEKSSEVRTLIVNQEGISVVNAYSKEMILHISFFDMKWFELHPAKGQWLVKTAGDERIHYFSSKDAPTIHKIAVKALKGLIKSRRLRLQEAGAADQDIRNIVDEMDKDTCEDKIDLDVIAPDSPQLRKLNFQAMESPLGRAHA